MDAAQTAIAISLVLEAGQRPAEARGAAAFLPPETPIPTSTAAEPAPATPQTAEPQTSTPLTAPPQPAAPPAPPYRGGPTVAQAPAPSSLPVDADPGVVGHRLLAETGGALARQQLHQIASLPGAQSGQRTAEAGPRWMFELPFSTPQGSAVAQFEISRDGAGGAAAAGEATWRARFSIDLEPMGPVHAQVALTGARAGVTLWAERPATADRLRAQQASLAKGLEGADFAPAISVQQGAPPRAAAPVGRFLDQAS